MPDRKQFKTLIVILTLALLFRLILALWINNCDSAYFLSGFDSPEFLALADNLRNSATFTQGSEPEIFRSPGYPAFICVFRLLWPHTTLPVILAQVLISSATCYLVWIFARRLFPARPALALLAAGLQALSVVSIIFTVRIFSETLFTFCLLSLFIMIHELSQWREKEIRWQSGLAAFCGALMGICCLLRPIMLPMLPIFFIFFWFLTFEWERKKRFAVLSAVIPMTLIPVAGWILRNYLATGYPCFATVMAVNLYYFYGLPAYAVRTGTDVTVLKELVYQQFLELRDGLGMTQVDTAKLAWEKGMAIFWDAPLIFIAVHLIGGFKSLSLGVCDKMLLALGVHYPEIGARSIMAQQGVFAGIWHFFINRDPILISFQLTAFALGLLKYFGVIIALLAFKRWPSWRFPILILLVTGYMLFMPGAGADYRFRVPAEPYIAIFAAFGLLEAIKAIIRQLSARFPKHSFLKSIT